MPDTPPPNAIPETSVAQRVLLQFASALEEDDTLKEIAPRMRALIESDDLSEASLRAAIFGETPG